MKLLRFYIALWAAKFTRAALRLCGRNATYLPGAVALKICPAFLRLIARPVQVVAVTGSNGKTTTSNLISDALGAFGLRVLNNRAGSNVAAGIAAVLVHGASAFNRARHDIAVLEIDERFAPKILPYVKPDIVVVTNLFRDSIMRNAHPRFIMDFLERGIPDGTKLLLNADDPISSALKQGSPRAFFGIERMDGDVTECVNLINDMRVCPGCGAELVYDYRRYHHIGKCRCPECAWASPGYDYAGAHVDFSGMTITIRDAGGEGQYKLPSDSVFNAYNLVTAAAALRELGYAHGGISAAVGGIAIAETRYNELRAGDTALVMQMSKDKNALAASRAFDYAASRPGAKEMILMMNCLGDHKKWSENICWLYDCDFEFLNREDITRIVAAGPRAADYYLRLLVAGVPEDRLRIAFTETDAPSELEYPPGGSVFIFYGTDSIDLAYKVRDAAKTLAGGQSPLFSASADAGRKRGT